MMSLPTEINTTLLLPRATRFDIGKVQAAIETRMTSTCPPFERCDMNHTQLLSSPDMHLQLHARDLPIPGERLERALSSQLANMMHDDPSVALARHRATITLSVGIGPTPAFQGQKPAPPTREVFERMLIFAHTGATQLARDCSPLAVHWGQSDQILSATRFAAMANMLFPLPLFLHPRPKTREFQGEDWLSLEVDGAQHLLGHRLCTENAPVALPWMMQRVYAFVSHLYATGQETHDGMGFATAEGERFCTRFDASGTMRLRLVELYGKPVPAVANEPSIHAA